MPEASKKCWCRYWGQMICVTENPGCGNLEKYGFERTGALTNAGWPKGNTPLVNFY